MEGNSQCSSSTHVHDHIEYHGASKEQRETHQHDSSEGCRICIVATVEHGVPLMMPKWSQHPWFHRKTSKTRSQDWRCAAPSPHEDMYSTPGPWKGSGLPPGPTSLRGVAKARRPQGSLVLQAAGLLPKASPVQKRIRTPTWALGARRLGLQEEGRASVLVGGGVSALPPPFPKG